HLKWSTISVFTSFAAVLLTFWRSPYYALGYAANDLVLIVLWTLQHDIVMILCFAVFLINDLYGFCNWRKMEKIQQEG
ncbi:nicotinamide mononucleotide transporter, partial [uncultured Dubosiella sp.]